MKKSVNVFKRRKFVSNLVYTALMLMGIVWLGITAFFASLSQVRQDAKPTSGPQIQSDIHVAKQFCQNVFQKDYEAVTNEELASIKYLKFYYGSTGLNEIQYSFHEYQDFETEKEFAKTIQSFETAMGYYTKSNPIDLTMFGKLKKLRKLNLTLLSTGNAIGMETFLEMPKLHKITLSGEGTHLPLHLYISSNKLVENTTIKEISLLNCHMWDMHTGEQIEEYFINHCKKLVSFRQEN